MGQGYLVVNLFLADHALPAGNITVLVRDNVGNLLHTLTADRNGVTEKVALDAPDTRSTFDPYRRTLRFATYDIEIPFSPGLKRVIIHDIEIFDTITTIQQIQMHPAIEGDTPAQNTDEIFIPLSHGVDLPGGRVSGRQQHPAPVQEQWNSPQDKPADTPGAADLPDPLEFATPTTPILANEVPIPSFITVHLGLPNSNAPNVRLPFIDYIKNVASSEIFPTWEEAAIYANVYCQISFALNRMYTLWYPSRGFDFDITNSTAFDQFFVRGRCVFENISRIVDNIFNMFLRRQGFREPFIAQFCNGTTSTCPGLSQWGSQELALNGYTPIEILRYYFPNDMQIVESNNFANNSVGVFGGEALREGSTGDDVRTMQVYLNRISGNFYIPPVGFPDGVFRSNMTTTVKDFQRINNLVADGIIGKRSWYAITKVYVGVRQLAELESEGERINIGSTPPTVVLSLNSRGPYVTELQFLLNFISVFFPTIPFVVEDGVFRESTKRAVTDFQLEFGLTPDGIVGPQTWQRLYDVFWSIENGVLFPHHYNNQ